MGHYIYFTPQYYKKVYGKTAEYNCIMFRAKDGYSEEQVKKAGEKILAKDQVLTISYLHDIKDQLDDMLASLNLVIIVLIVSAGMLAFVVLYNLNNINITERQRELATLKVLGFYDGEVASYVYRENMVLTVFGILAGVGIGAFLHGKVYQEERDNVGVEGSHFVERSGEAALHYGRHKVRRAIREHPAKAAARAESRYIKATADYHSRKFAQELSLIHI